MGSAIPQVIAEDRASGAQVIDGSLRFNDDIKQFLKRTPSSVGNRRTFTFSCWTKRSELAAYPVLFSAGSASGDTGYLQLSFEINPLSVYIRHNTGGNPGAWTIPTSAFFRDTSWYHIVMAVDTTAAASDRVKLYVNGAEQLISNLPTITENFEFLVNNNGILHQVGAGRNSAGATSVWYDGHLSNVYFIDGQALGPESFGFTDPLTNTWRPKKYTGTFTRSSVNDGTTWSSSVSGTVDSTYPLSNAFGGTIGSSYTSGTRPTVGNTLTFDISSKNLTVAKVRLNTFLSVNNGNATLQVNDTDVTTNLSDGDQTHEITINGQFNNVKWSYDNGNGPYVYMRGIEVDLGTGRGYELLTDGLTDTGANSFYLPMDGNSPVGEDKSGNGNDWTPVNFGGSVALNNPIASGALPIYNTINGGRVAAVGVRTDSSVGGIVHSHGTTISYNTLTDYSKFAIFDGNASNGYGDRPVSNNGLNFTTIPQASTSVEIRCSIESGTIATNAGDLVTGPASTDWRTVSTTYPFTLTSISVSGGSQSEGFFIYGIRVDGVEILDGSKLSLALPLYYNADDVSNQIDSKSTTKVVAVTNAITSNAHSNFYGGSYYFDGNTDYITVTDNSDLELGTGDFCYEGWFYSSTLASGVFLLFDSTQGTGVYFYTTNGSLYLYLGSSQVASDYACLANNKWTHIAFVREGGTGKIYCDGILVGSGSKPEIVNGGNLVIGSSVGGGNYFTGYMQDVRVYVGTSKYTSNFIPVSTDPDILPDTPSGVSGGSKLAKITSGTVAFDGTGDSLRVEDHADFTFGGGDYTIEAFVYIDSTGWNALVTKYSTHTQSDRSWWWGLNNGRQEFYHHYNNGLNNLNTNSPKSIYGKWTHCAVAREGNTIRIFDDGQLSATIDLSTVPASQTMTDGSGPLVIGQDADSSTYDMDGFISNVRVIKGTALYTANFTPPTEPLTNVTNTKLLCCQSVDEQQNNFIRMFKSTSLYTTKADILANATEIADGDSLASEYWYIVPTGTEPIDGDNNKAFSIVPSWNINTKFYYYNTGNSTWTGISGGYSNADYVFVSGGTLGFSYQDNDTSNSYAINPARDFYVCGNTSGTNQPVLLTGNAPTRIRYYKFDGAVKPTGSNIIGNQNTTATNFNPFSTDINTVRGQETGYCTFNVLRERAAGYNPTFKDGNLFMDGRGDGTGTLSASSGKFYYEVLIDTVTNNSQMYIGVQDAAHSGHERSWTTAQIAAIRDQAAFYGDGSTGTALGYAEGDLLSFAFDADDNKLYIAKNGIYMNGGNPSQGTGFTHSGINFAGGYTPLVSDANVGQKFRANFGQKPFKFPPPDGFQPLNAASIRPETVIARPDQYVGVTTYRGNGDSDALADTAIDTSTAYRYHRILFEGDNNGGSVSEIEFYDANGNKIDASDTNNAGNSINSNATQGLDHWTAFNGTRGGSDYSQGVRKDAGVGAVGFYISKDWGSGQTKTIYGVKVWGVNSYGLAGNTSGKYMKLQGSNDNSNWTDLQTWNSARHGSWTTDSANQVGHISDQTIYNPIKLGMQPDLVWIKKTSGSNSQHRLVDSVRGPNEELYSDTDQDSGSNNGLNSFDPDGFTVWTSNAGYNEFGQDYVAWTWKAGGEVGVGRSFMTDGVGFSTAGDAGFNPQATEIAPDSASISTKAGFSIVKYTGSGTDNDAVLHGLSQKPDFVIVKNITTSSTDWRVWSSAYGDNRNLRLNKTGDRSYWNEGNIYGHTSSDTAITLSCAPSTNLSDDVNLSGNEYIMYSWHNVPGLQKFGVYRGNGDANGPYIELGFRPALVIVKYANNDGGSANWYIFNSKMGKYNPINPHVTANESATAGTGHPIDFLSNGFKLRYADNVGHTNLGSTQFIYAAWAESPAVNLYGGQSNAR